MIAAEQSAFYHTAYLYPPSPSHLSPTSIALTRPDLPSFPMPLQHPGPSSPRGKLARRASRADPMYRTEDDMFEDDEGYGELGQRHPLRRVKEDLREVARHVQQVQQAQAAEQQGEGVSVSLPSIKALFGAADHPTSLSSSSSSSLYHSPSLPSLVPNSPTSPSSARTSRLSSLASSAVIEPAAPGWWAPEFERNPFQASAQRSRSFPNAHPFASDEHDSKRRRSDGPLALRDTEESARMKWQAQSRNASYPSASSSSSGPTTPIAWSATKGRLHPPRAPSAGVSAAMSRGSLSAMSGGPSSPAGSRRTSPTSRSSSLVGGQLSRHFADLPMPEGHRVSFSGPAGPLDRRSSTQASSLITPTERRSSMLPPLMTESEYAPLSSLTVPRTRRSISDNELRRCSISRPVTPDEMYQPDVRRSSLTEIIKAKSGDDVAMREGRYNWSTEEPRAATAFDQRPFFSEPGPMSVPSNVHGHLAGPSRGLMPPVWMTQERRESTESIASAAGHLALSSDTDALSEWSISHRGRKRSAARREDDDISMSELSGSSSVGGDPGMRGMEVLAVAAAGEGKKKKGEEEGEEEGDEERDEIEGKLGAIGGPKYTCTFCAKTFSRPSSLKIHTYSHTGEKPYVCHEGGCGRRFSVQSNLKRHAKVHQVGSTGISNAAPASSPPVSAPPTATVQHSPPLQRSEDSDRSSPQSHSGPPAHQKSDPQPFLHHRVHPPHQHVPPPHTQSMPGRDVHPLPVGHSYLQSGYAPMPIVHAASIAPSGHLTSPRYAVPPPAHELKSSDAA